jgi:DNA-binding response OmpR family regulator
MTMTQARRRPHGTARTAVAGRRRLLRVQTVSIDLDGRRVFAGTAEVRLSPKEFELLRLLLENAGTIIGRRELLDTVWCPGYPGDNKTLETHIRRLRRKLGPPAPAMIRTVRGTGYIFDVAADQLTGPQE